MNRFNMESDKQLAEGNIYVEPYSFPLPATPEKSKMVKESDSDKVKLLV